MITVEQIRKVSEDARAKNKVKKWNIFDTLQLAWFEMRIKRMAKKGKRKVSSDFYARPNVQVNLEKKGIRVWKDENLGTVIRW